MHLIIACASLVLSIAILSVSIAAYLAISAHGRSQAMLNQLFNIRLLSLERRNPEPENTRNNHD